VSFRKLLLIPVALLSQSCREAYIFPLMCINKTQHFKPNVLVIILNECIRTSVFFFFSSFNEF